jgi:hypothetical protein
MFILQFPGAGRKAAAPYSVPPVFTTCRRGTHHVQPTRDLGREEARPGLCGAQFLLFNVA